MNASTPLFPSWSNPFALSLPVQSKKSDWRYLAYSRFKDELPPDPLEGLVNLADLPETGTGEAFVYGYKPSFEHNAILIFLIPAYPLEAIATIAYNILRIVPVVVFITGHLFYEWASQKDGEQKTFREVTWSHIKEMGRQIWLSIANVIRTPFYLLAILFGILYAVVKPLDGRRWVAQFDFDWNHRISRAQSLWLTMGFQRDFHFESFQFKKTEKGIHINSKPISQLGYNALYIAGCYQVNQIAYFENFNLKEIKSLSKNHTCCFEFFEQTNKASFLFRECLL